MRPIFVASLSIAFTALAQTTAVPSTTARDYEEPEAYAVYEAILGEPFLAQAKAKSLLVQRETEGAPLCEGWDKESQPRIRSAISDYQTKVKTAWLLQPVLELSVPSIVASKMEIASYFNSEDSSGSAFDRQYPDSHGYVVLSAVGFNADRTIAIVSETFVSRPAATRHIVNSAGGFHALEKRDGHWVPAKLPGTCGWGGGAAGGVVF